MIENPRKIPHKLYKYQDKILHFMPYSFHYNKARSVGYPDLSPFGTCRGSCFPLLGGVSCVTVLLFQPRGVMILTRSRPSVRRTQAQYIFFIRFCGFIGS